MARLAAPASADLEVLAVDLPMRVDRARRRRRCSGRRSRSGRRHAPGRALPRSRAPTPAASITTSTPSPCVQRAHLLEPLRRRRRRRDRRHGRRPCARARSRRSRGAPMAKTGTAPPSRASAIALRPTAPVPCTSTRVARAQRGALEDVHGGEQPAARRRCSRRTRPRRAAARCRRRARDRSPATIRRTVLRAAESVMP